MEKRRSYGWQITSITVLLLVLLMVSFLLKNFDTMAATPTDATVQAYESQIAKLKKEQAELEQKILTAQKNQTSALETKKYLDLQATLTADKIEMTQNLIEEYNRQIATKNGEIADMEDKITRQYENFKTRIRISYEEGTANYLEMILGAENLSDFLTRVDRVGTILEYDSKLIEEYRQTKANLSDAKARLDETLEKQKETYAELEKDKASLELQLKKTATYLGSLAKDEEGYIKQHDEIAEQEKKIDKELERYIKELQAKNNKNYVGGSFGWPVPIEWKTVSSKFGWRVYYYHGAKVSDYHTGIDIPANSGTAIYAANAGTVIISTYHPSYGYYILIDHGGGKATLYAHASKLLAKVDQEVKKGETIALVGTTGNSTGNHLHFEIRINGEKVDPLSGNYLVIPN